MSKTSKCSAQLDDVALDGSYVSISNKSYSSDFDLGGWTLERTYGPKRTKSLYKFPADFKIKGGLSVTVYSYAFEDHAKRDDLVAKRNECKTWGTGEGSLILTDTNNAEKATCQISESRF